MITFRRYYLDKFLLSEKFSGKYESILDIGTGEMTTLTSILNKIEHTPEKTFAFDISWSRIAKGINYIKQNLKKETSLHAFVGDINAIPLHTNSVSVITSNHALEPNGNNLKNLLSELFRVAKDILILFEPCYEINSDKGKKRMDKLGYIKNIDQTISSAGGTLIEKIKIKNTHNPLNPTMCFIIKPPETHFKRPNQDSIYSLPGTDFSLEKMDNFYFSNDAGLSFPILKEIPILRESSAILSTSLIKPQH